MAGADNLFLAYLPLMRAQLDRMGHTLEDVIMRLDHVERTVAGHSGELAGINTKLDRLDAQITRIEKRLDIVEG
jgi:archaellum component FlaC